MFRAGPLGAGAIRSSAMKQSSMPPGKRPLNPFYSRFPDASPDDLRKRMVTLMAAPLIQDMGYYPLQPLIQRPDHYVRTGDFIGNMLANAQDLDKCSAFRRGFNGALRCGLYRPPVDQPRRADAVCEGTQKIWTGGDIWGLTRGPSEDGVLFQVRRVVHRAADLGHGPPELGREQGAPVEQGWRCLSAPSAASPAGTVPAAWRAPRPRVRPDVASRSACRSRQPARLRARPGQAVSAAAAVQPVSLGRTGGLHRIAPAPPAPAGAEALAGWSAA